MKLKKQNPLLLAATTLASFVLSLAAPSAYGATETFNTEGTFDWVCPPGITVIQVECWGGGGAGGVGNRMRSGNYGSNGGGGGGGAYARSAAVGVTPGFTYNFTIPAAAHSGDNGTTTNGDGAVNGGDVSFVGDSLVTTTAAGGKGGLNYVLPATAPNYGAGGAGGGAGGTVAASVGDVRFAGGAGSRGIGTATNVPGSGGGGAGDANNGGAAVTGTSTSTPGNGGTTGGGNGGQGNGMGNTPPAGSSVDGSPGALGGGGGGGGHHLGTGISYGGDGGLGQIVLTYAGPEVVKANNPDDLSLTTSWVGGLVPVSGERAKWDATVTGANTVSLGSDLTFDGIVIANPAGPVTLNPGNTLTLGAEVVDLDLSAATQDLTLNCDLNMGAPNVWDVAAGRTLTLGGTVSGSATITIQGSGTVKLAAAEVIPHGTGTGNLTLNGTLDLNGFNEEVNGFSGTGVVDNTAASTASVLTVGNNNQAGSFSGTLQNSGSSASLELIKNGTGALTLGGANSYSGGTTINGGAVTIQDATGLGTTAAGTVVNGTGTGNASNARLDLSGGITVTGEALTISGVGNWSGALSGAGGDNEWAGNVTIAPTGAGVTRLGALANSTLRVSGVIDSGFVDTGLIIRSANITDSTVILSGANTYLGDTSVVVGKLQLDGGDNRLPVATRITMGASANFNEFDLNGWNQEVAGLAINSGATAANNFIFNSSGTLSTLTVNTATSPSFFAGIIEDNIALTKSGADTLTLAGANTYTGATNVTEGTLLLSTAGSGVSDVRVSGGASAGALVEATDGKFFNVGDLSLGDKSVLTIDYGATNPSTTVAPFDVDNFTVGTGLGLLVRGSNLAGLAATQSYPLVTWTASGPADGSAFTTVLNPRLQGTFSVSANTLLFTVTSNTGASPISWNTGNGTWNTTTSNWVDVNLATTTFFDTFDAVLFGDAAGATGNPVITLNTAVSPTGVVMNSTARNYTISGTGSIGGNASLTLDPANTGTLTILNDNSFTGTTAVNGGTLQLGNGGAGGSLGAASPVSIGTGATFAVNQSDTVTQGTDFGSAAISGEGTFAQTGTGTTILNAANTFSGSTVIRSGTLQATVNTTGSGVGTSAVSVAAGTVLLLDNTATSGATAINNTFTGDGLLKLQFAAGTTARNTNMPNVAGFAGTIQLSSPGANGDKWNAAGVGTVPGSVIVDDGNSLYFPNGTPSFTGGITLNGAGNTEGRGAIRLSATLGGNISLASDSTINLDKTTAVLTGDISSGAAGSQTLTLGATGSTGGTLSGVIGGGTGTLNLATAVGGTYTLTNANTYTGGTSLNAGIINVNNSQALGTGTAAVNGGVRYVLGNGVDVANAFVLGTNAGVAGNGLIQVATGNTATVSGPITINSGASAGGHFATLGTGVLNLAGVITSSVGVTQRTGTVIYSGGGSGYTSLGVTGTTIVGTDNGIATTATVTLGTAGAAGILDLNGFNQSLEGIAKAGSPGTIGNSSTTSDSTLTTTGTSAFAGVIQDVVAPGTMKVQLTVDGGQLTLSGANSYTGTTQVNAGTLALGANNTLPDASPVAIGAGTLDAATFTDTLGAIDATEAATINLGTGAALAFADSSAIDWTGGSLTITGAFVSGSSLRFGTTDAGLTDTQLGLISAAGFTDFDLDANGYLIATGGGYSGWAATNAGGQAADLDFDNDGMKNSVEYFMNAAAGFTANPQLDGSNTITWTNGGNIPASAYGTQFVIQTSPDLATWTEVPVGSLTTNTDGPGGSLTYTLTGAAPRFVRLKVTPN